MRRKETTRGTVEMCCLSSSTGVGSVSQPNQKIPVLLFFAARPTHPPHPRYISRREKKRRNNYYYVYIR
jgi:hypothetical protein